MIDMAMSMIEEDVKKAEPLTLKEPPRILVVEDDPAMAQVIARLLESNWFYSVVRHDGRQGTAALSTEAVDLVITDLQMAAGDGVSLIESLRENSNIPVIVVTGYSNEYAERLQSLENVTVITKPFENQKLLDTVEQAIQAGRGAERAAGLGTGTVREVVEAYAPAHKEARAVKRKILIADDDREHLLMMALMLRKEGYEVVSAFDAKHAVQATVENDPDLLLLDVHMGEEDGYSVQERLQKVGEMAEKPVIYITGDKSNWVNCIINGLGGGGILRKPFNREELLKSIRAILS